ncbi:DUF1906 domain-containing protein [Streptomyces sp. TR06-5]|uniref:DUF1906 domain-containing protein n=1 Tax=unclassified Streptomyces TaxID=2593676 RepID=UPI0039A30E58
MIRRIVVLVSAYASLFAVAPAGPAHADTDPARDAAVFTGRAFDTCQAPSTRTMEAWTASPYRAVGVYIGGRGRACPDQQHLTPGWVRSVTAMGWYLLPLYVGSQSPCVHSDRKRSYALDPWRAEEQGASEGRDAVRSAQDLGMQPGSPLYLDMEAYDQDNTRCARNTLRFVQAWNREVRRLGYLPGFYSSAGSGVAHMQQARNGGRRNLPEILWFARWNTAPDVRDEPVLNPGDWQPHRRIHQYRGNVTETHGGHRITIDRNWMDAPVAKIA